MTDQGDRMTYDVVIVGGGVAGLSAALLLTRARRTVAVIDAGEPRNAPAQHVHGFLSRDGESPQALLDAGRNEILGYGGTIIQDRVHHISRRGNTFAIACENTEIESYSVLIATGIRDELPDIPGVSEQWGIDVVHCPYCHGYEVRDTPIAVIGGDNRPFSIHQASLLRQWSTDVVFFPHTIRLTRDERQTITSRGVAIREGHVTRIATENGRVVGVELGSDEIVPRSTIFVGPQFLPQDSLLVDMGCLTLAEGRVFTDPTGMTNVAGAWAAGNVVDSSAQLINAAAAGSKAGIAINHFLMDIGLWTSGPSPDRSS